MERYRASFFLDEGEEEEAYFFFLVCAPQIERGESEVQVYFVVVGVLLIFWSKGVPRNEIMRNPFSQICFLHETSTRFTLVLCAVHALFQSGLLLSSTADDRSCFFHEHNHIMNECFQCCPRFISRVSYLVRTERTVCREKKHTHILSGIY